MAELDRPPLFSPQWHRLKNVNPRWNLGVSAVRHYERGERFYIVSNSSFSRSLKLNQAAWDIFGRCQGQVSAEHIWMELNQLRADHAPTQGDMLELLAHCFENQLLHSSDLLSFDTLNQTAQQHQRRDMRGRFSPMGMRIDLGNPTRIMSWFKPFAKPIFSPLGLLLWVIAMGYLVTQSLNQYTTLTSELSREGSQPGYWLLMWLCFIPIKAFHEFSHALAASAYRVPTGQAGISWMLLSPAPYVDISAADSLPSKLSRVVISAAGIASELLIAAIALVVWSQTEPGLPHTIALACFSTASLSTLLFNGNPLMKMDGYYVLIDALGLPNLAARSNQWWSQRWQQSFGQSSSAQQMVTGDNETPWLIVYCPASWLWRAGIFISASAWLGSIYGWLGIGIGLAGLWTQLVLPVSKWIKQYRLTQANFFQALRQRPKAAFVGLLVLSLATLLPVPDRLVQPGIVWLAGDEAIKAQADGFTPEQLSASDTFHQLTLSDPKLLLELERNAARIKGIKVKIQQAQASDRAQAAVHEQQLEQAQAQAKHLNQKLSQLTAQSSLAGVASWVNPADLAGRWVKTGEVLGYVRALDTTRPITIQIAIEQSQAARLGFDPSAVLSSAKIHLVSGDNRAQPLINATVNRSRPSALTELPSKALSSQFGGPIATDPSDSDALKPLNPTFGLQLQVNSAATTTWIHGAKVVAVLDFGYSSFAWQTWRLVQEQIRNRFAAQWV